MTRRSFTAILLLLLAFEISGLAQRRPSPGPIYRPPTPSRPIPKSLPPVRRDPNTNRPIPTKPPVVQRRQPQATATARPSGTVSAGKPLSAAPIPAVGSPQYTQTKASSSAKLTQLRASLKARLRSSSALNKSGAVSEAKPPGSSSNSNSTIGPPAPLREAYEAEVKGLARKEEQLRGEGKSPEEIARALHAERRNIGEKYKDLTPPELLKKIYARNLKLYGDKLGPSIKYLRAKGKSWEDIIDSAKRPGGKDIDFK